MPKTLTKDARGFVEGVVTYLRQDGRSKTVLPKVQAFLGKVTTQARKEKVAKVESSVLLSGEEKDAVARALAKLLGHEVHIENAVNPALIGGLRIQVGDWIVDMTLKNQVEQIGTMLLQ